MFQFVVLLAAGATPVAPPVVEPQVPIVFQEGAQPKPEDKKPEDKKPEDKKPEDTKPGEVTPMPTPGGVVIPHGAIAPGYTPCLPGTVYPGRIIGDGSMGGVIIGDPSLGMATPVAPGPIMGGGGGGGGGGFIDAGFEDTTTRSFAAPASRSRRLFGGNRGGLFGGRRGGGCGSCGGGRGGLFGGRRCR